MKKPLAVGPHCRHIDYDAAFENDTNDAWVNKQGRNASSRIARANSGAHISSTTRRGGRRVGNKQESYLEVAGAGFSALEAVVRQDSGSLALNGSQHAFRHQPSPRWSTGD